MMQISSSGRAKFELGEGAKTPVLPKSLFSRFKGLINNNNNIIILKEKWSVCFQKMNKLSSKRLNLEPKQNSYIELVSVIKLELK